MRHKYSTRGVVLARTPLREAGATVTLVTEEFGLVRARAEGLRKPGAKLAHALQALDECSVTLVRGKEGWRLSGALLEKNWFTELSRSARLRVARVVSLFLRVAPGDEQGSVLYGIFHTFLEALPGASEELQDAAECIAALTWAYLRLSAEGNSYYG
jgi:recombinational DNA repair protein (RecF pathway)